MTTDPRATGPAVRERASGGVREMRTDPKIQARHLARHGRIYVRQSHPNQVLRHPESARRQYGLVERAEQLGWPREQIGVIDEDQGKSAAGSAAAHGRDGFADLVSQVGLGEVGIVLALEVSRLARNSALCRCRHKADYAALGFMPRSAPSPSRVVGPMRHSRLLWPALPGGSGWDGRHKNQRD